MHDPEAPRRLYHNARREAVIVGVVWLLALVWSVGYCYLFGYQHAADSWVVQAGLASVRGPGDLQLIAGMPDWVVVGILVPWILCTLFTIVFCQFIMTDDDLGIEAKEGNGAEEGSHGH